MKKRLIHYLSKIVRGLDRLLYKKNQFVIISNNCWGAEIYQRLGVPYNTPFVGLFIFGPDYIKLLENLEHYLNFELTFKKESNWISHAVKYPIGLLDDIEIHFMHYKDDQQAKSNWTRRLERMNAVKDRNDYFYKICDRDLTNSDIILKFHDLPFKNKISFGINSLSPENHFHITENENNKTVPDGLQLYKCSFKYIDLLAWVTTGKITQNSYSKIKSDAKVS